MKITNHEVVRDDLDPRHRVHPTVMRGGADERREGLVGLRGVGRATPLIQSESFGIIVTHAWSAFVRPAMPEPASLKNEK